MRIISGTFRSRQLRSLKGLALRPTSDRLRETLFNVLAGRVDGSRFLDLFAGTGAVGIEALSRGASLATFIENHPPAVALIKKNLDSLAIRDGVRILPLDALQALKRLAGEAAAPRLDLIFMDPPYAEESLYGSVLSFLGASDLLSEDPVVIAEHRRGLDLPASFGKLERVRVLLQGDAALSFYRVPQSNLPEKPLSE